MIVKYLLNSENKQQVNYQKIRSITLAVGMITLSLGLLLPRFFTGNGVDFMAGFFMGISIVANMMSIVLIKKCKKS